MAFNEEFHHYLLDVGYQHRRVEGGRYAVKDKRIALPPFDLYLGVNYLYFVTEDGLVDRVERDPGFEKFLACFTNGELHDGFGVSDH